MSKKKAPREFWIDPEILDEDFGEENQVYDAFSVEPVQGPLSWRASLIYVREVLPEPEISEEEIERAKLEYFENIIENEDDYEDLPYDYGYPLKMGFEAGAKWMREKIKGGEV